MGVCEPGQGGNAAAISNAFMCAGEPPRLSQTSPRTTETQRVVDPGRNAARSTRFPDPRRLSLLYFIVLRHDGARLVASAPGSKKRTTSKPKPPEIGAGSAATAGARAAS